LRVRPSLEERYKTEVLALKARFKQATPEEIAELTALRRGRGVKLLPTRDANGFRRQIVALAPSGALVSLHNGDGRVMWRRFLGGGVDPDGEPASAYNYSAVLPWRPSGDHHTADAAEHALVLGTTSAAAACGSRMRRERGVVEVRMMMSFRHARVLPPRFGL
jgi:hypothetical protein